ncbi:lysine ketoglutarate reductase trans-splicing protein [Zea mays]|uniref:Lysine ketoglutarate reductase trans-splicing protein n=1 Tax=Zea mays TaxID=4577 RepID=A0A1D6Q2R5_MAIZE|nr:lysine ketoglutarate reductase trans-splicing protein [Zea mays]
MAKPPNSIGRRRGKTLIECGSQLHFPSSIISYIEDRNSGITTQTLLNHAWASANNRKKNSSESNTDEIPKVFDFVSYCDPFLIVLLYSYYVTAVSYHNIYVPTNPKGAERLPPGIVVSETDLYPRRLWGDPSEDLTSEPRYLVTFTVGIGQKANIDAAVKKFSDKFTIMLFHYDGRTTEWDEFEWSKRAIHVSVRKQTKWWYAKRFLHPDVVARYDYIFIWDEDLGVEHFNAEKYIELVRKHGLEISQPGLQPDKGLTWQMTKRRGDQEVHKVTEERPGWCTDPHLPPCAAFVEIMATVFSRNAWRCVWHMIQNDLVHGWGLDFALRKCVEPAHEKIGVVDAQWIVHQAVPSLGNQGKSDNGRAPWEGVRARCRKEWGIFQTRLADAEKAYYLERGITPPNSTVV